jgi:hypothetical protein
MQGGFLDKTLSKFFRFLILFVFLLAGFFCFGESALAETINITEDLEILEDAVWKGGDKIIIKSPNGVYVSPGGILTIEPGAIVKLDVNKYLATFGGTINIEGDANNPIIITSLKDDNAGGDDNNDGDATAPSAGDWMSIIAEGPGSIINIDYAEIKYAGAAGAVVISEADQVNINHSSIIQNQYSIKAVNFNSVNIENSNLFNPECIPTDILGKEVCGIGIWNYGANQIIARNNYWGHNQGPSTFDSMFIEDEIRGTLAYGNVEFNPYLTSEWELPEPEPTGPEPIIFVPGVTACINLKVLTDLEESSYDWEIFGTYYQGLIKTIETAGFTRGEDFFIGCYDWRKTNGYNPDETVNSGEEYLMHWIDQALENSSSTKVDIVAHSMGGLLSRSYIQGNRYRDDVDQFIMLGTPNYGSSDAYYMWEGGESPENWNEFKWILRTYLTYLKFKGLNITNVNTVHEKIPSIKQLLPTYDYVKNKETELIILNSLMEEQNTWLKELNEEENLNKLTERTASVKIINGDGVSTSNTITVADRTLFDVTFNKWPDGRPDENIIDNRDNGDGTVLSSSVLIDGIASSTILGVKHSELPDQAALLVLQELGLESEQVFSSPEVADMLIVIVASPVEPVVTTADNKQVGGGVNEIENAQYFSAGDSGVKIIAIPNPASGDFTVNLTGNGDGSYSMASIYSNSGSTISAETSGEVFSGQNITYNSSLQSGDSPSLGALSLPAEETEENEPQNSSPGGSVPLWLLREMSKQPKVLGVKIHQPDERDNEIPGNTFKINLIYSPAMEKALLNNFINFLRYSL